MLEKVIPKVAYFCMEVGLGEPNLPTYSGGLGVLAGDTLRSAADLAVPMVGVTLLYRQGYFHQSLDAQGRQSESPERWRPEDHLELMPAKLRLVIEGREVNVRAWRYLLEGATGGGVPVYFLDADLPENHADDRALTGQLYGDGGYYRLRQEALLGLGGVAMLRALGHDRIDTFHMNEGHSALLAVALLEVELAGRGLHSVDERDVEAVRQRCVFTTHTPVPAAMDKHQMHDLRRVLGEGHYSVLEMTGCIHDGVLNMTDMALRFSRYINGVAMRHGEVSRGMFPNYPINSITNGVHAGQWASPAMAALFDRHIPEWRRDNLYLRYAISIPRDDIRAAHLDAKRKLIERIRADTGRTLSEETFTLGFARRATEYKRADFLFRDMDRLRSIAAQHGGLQIVFGGKAHPADGGGKDLIRRIFEAADALRGVAEVVYLPNYDMEMARTLIPGVDLWLNTPRRPNEASGTSGMKAAVSGVPSLSVMDGWWIEGNIEGVTGWAIGDGGPQPDSRDELQSLYDKLEHIILPMFRDRPDDYASVMRNCIAHNGSFFNTHRMVGQYVSNAYRLRR